ncbi:hypothetical protein ACRS6Y_05345 [Bacillus cytotoxicus]|uniref:hypothetical protein n=1 Tax=Bacillus cytotoxicus TaxID=580165 RepID=UPI00065FF1E1|nr:hypothetical protein [Bacillus cytotoxicus]AWC27746.1 hypothetical protein CG483_004705 [Bacillus cytotoxicus]AWC31727.1 hypothetical protein CG482_004320 [Bacillus cytotoxicus]AWC35765.1 hypothetical protein CG481_004320 [Bacillus cytotoxicus]AWC40876.1 hypothetical protein CG480_010550 [Bacillus cytotoxicus]AWC48807.1 hypothetical protein CG478_010550 [Bacillus cytotoxicus]
MKKFLLFLQGCFWLNIGLLPLSFFIGSFATDPPDSTTFDFLKGFLLIQGIPLTVFIIGFLILIVINNKKE